MNSQTQGNLPAIIEGELETVLVRGHQLDSLIESLNRENRRIIVLWPVCQSEWHCTIATMPTTTVGQSATNPSSIE